MNQSKAMIITVVCCILLITTSCISCRKSNQANRKDPYLYLEMNVKPLDKQSETFSKQDLTSIKAITEKRIEYLGATSKAVAIQGQTLIIEIFGYTDLVEAKTVLGKPGKLTFTDEQDNTILTGEHMKSVTYSMREMMESGKEQSVIELEFDDEGTRLLAKGTANNLGKMIMIKLDDEVLMSPVVHDTIENGKVILTFGGSSADSVKIVQQVAALLKGGTIPAIISITTAEIR